VRVILLPEGEDPDSFAKSHNASDLKVFLESNQHDFIRFKTQLLMEDAQNDPTKRSEMINQIIYSIASIPDSAKREIYIKDTASFLNITSNILHNKVTEIHNLNREERAKRRDENEQIIIEINKIESNILNLLQVIIRYGEKALYQLEDGEYINVGEYIIREMRADNINIENPTHQCIINEFMKHCHEKDFISSTFFQHYPDAKVSQLAVDLIVEPYQLSRMYSKRSISENVTQEIQQDETAILPELVQRLLLELKLTVVEERLDTMEKLLSQAVSDKNDQLITAILEQQPQLMDIRTQLCRALGNRVIVR
jgi:DNA primase